MKTLTVYLVLPESAVASLAAAKAFLDGCPICEVRDVPGKNGRKIGMARLHMEPGKGIVAQIRYGDGVEITRLVGPFKGR